MAKHYRVLHGDGSLLEVEGDIVEWKGQRALLDGGGKPWLLFSDEDVITEVGMESGAPGLEVTAVTSAP